MLRKINKKFSTVNNKEMSNFSKINDWWDLKGSSKGLHAYNPRRLEFIKKHVISRKKINSDFYFLDNIEILDIGCGGGLLSESMARLSGNVKAIDANQNSIDIAQGHLDEYSPELKPNLEYQLTTIENFLKFPKNLEKFDIVTSMEVIEHVDDLDCFLKSAAQSLKKGGIFFLSSLNKNFFSYFFTIVIAEKVLGIVPNGTHNFDKYIDNEVLTRKMNNLNLDLLGIEYFMYDPVGNVMEKDNFFKFQYCIAFEKIQ